MLALHGWLLFPWQDNYSVGWYLVTSVSIPLLGSLITGLLVFKRFWRVYYWPRLRTRGIEDLTALQLISVSMVPLHFGDFGGLVFKLIWFLFGGLLSIMVCSGFFIWSRRTLVSTKKLRARDNDVSGISFL